MIWPTLVKNWENWEQVGNQCFERSVVTGGPPLQARLNTNGAIITIVLLSTIIRVITLIIFVLILHINMSKRRERLQIKLNNMFYDGMCQLAREPEERKA